MNAGWRFRPPAWAWLLALLGIALTGRLALWQWQRGQDKAALVASYAAAAAAPLRDWQPGVPADPDQVQRLRLRGEYLPDRQLLLDNQSSGGRVGYHVWTPLRTPAGALVLVDRGWVPADPDRRRLPAMPAPAGPQVLEGYWRPLPRPGLRLGDAGECRPRGFPERVQFPTLEDLRCRYPDQPLAEGLLLLAPELPGGFERRWNLAAVEMPPEKHYGYALQWLALCLTVVVLFIKLNLKKRRA